MTTLKDSQPMITYRLVSHCKTLGHGKNVRGDHLLFQNEAKNSPRQAFVMMNVSCKLENCVYYTFCSTGGNEKISAHCIMTDNETPLAAIFFFKLRPKIFPVKIL